jgi:hypothetical protein
VLRIGITVGNWIDVAANEVGDATGEGVEEGATAVCIRLESGIGKTAVGCSDGAAEDATPEDVAGDGAEEGAEEGATAVCIKPVLGIGVTVVSWIDDSADVIAEEGATAVCIGPASGIGTTVICCIDDAEEVADAPDEALCKDKILLSNPIGEKTATKWVSMGNTWEMVNLVSTKAKVFETEVSMELAGLYSKSKVLVASEEDVGAVPFKESCMFGSCCPGAKNTNTVVLGVRKA